MPAKAINWTNQRRRLGDLIPWERNPRYIDQEGADRLLQSYTDFGQVETIAIGPKDELYNGHQRLAVLLSKYGGDHLVDVRVADRALTEGERERLTVYLHKGATGQWNMDELANWDMDDLLSWGFKQDDFPFDVEPARAEKVDATPKEDKAAILAQEWGVEPGQVWQLPSRTSGITHRLICGDCTDPDVVTQLLQGNKPQILFTSPPYWVGFDYEQEDHWQEVCDFIQRFCALYVQHVAGSGRIIINTGTVQAGQLTGQGAHMRLLIDLWASALEGHGWLLRYVRFWVKDGGLLHTAPTSDCIDQHTEFIGYFYNPNNKFRGHERTGEPWAGKGYWDDIPGTARQSGHVAAFPLELVDRNVRLFTKEGEAVLEPFCGSGTTVISCENLGRVCYASELLAPYAALTLQRYQDTFGITPQLCK